MSYGKAKTYDPLSWVPTAKAVREQLDEAKRTVERLTVLLDIAERLESIDQEAKGGDHA